MKTAIEVITYDGTEATRPEYGRIIVCRRAANWLIGRLARERNGLTDCIEWENRIWTFPVGCVWFYVPEEQG